MAMTPYKPFLGQTIQTTVPGLATDRGFIAHVQYSALQALLAVQDAIHATFATSDVAVTTVTTNITNPTCPKNVTVTAGGVAADVKAVSVTITGTNDLDEVITEVMPAFTVNALSTEIGTKAFKTITSIAVPAMDGVGVTIDVGIGEKLGLPYKLTHNTVLAAAINNVREAVAPTVTVSPTAIESNTIDLDTALGGTVVDVYLIV